MTADAFRAAVVNRMLGARTVGEGTVLARAGFLYACFKTALRGLFIFKRIENKEKRKNNIAFFCSKSQSVDYNISVKELTI